MNSKITISLPIGAYNTLTGIADGKGITVSRAAAEIVIDFLDSVTGEEYELNPHGGKREGAGRPKSQD